MNPKEIKELQLKKLNAVCNEKDINFESILNLLNSEKIKKLQKKNHYIQQTIIDEIEKAIK
jgi:hypothetical protein